MPDLRISDIAEETGLSMRYWQRRAASGDIPGTTKQLFGPKKRVIYFIDAESFNNWWPSQRIAVKPCPEISRSADASGGTGSRKTGARSKVHSIQRTMASLRSECAASSKS
jgi:hypothetical protein